MNSYEKKAKEKKKRKRRRIIKRIIALIILIGIIGCASVAGYAYYVIKNDAHEIDTATIYDQMSQRTVVYDDKGKEISTISVIGGNRTLLKYAEIPTTMRAAIVSIEDKTFFDHKGFNFKRMVGAVLEMLRGGGQISGTSTITQQLARNIYLEDVKSERSIKRKILEAYYTVQIEKSMSKEEILEAYLNTVYFGFDCYGISAAADNYFGKDAKDLDIAEAAALAALPQSPDVYALVKVTYDKDDTKLPIIEKNSEFAYLYNGELTKGRRNTAIKLMAENEFISDVEKKEALEESEDLQKHIHIGGGITAQADTYYVDYTITKVTEDLMEKYGMDEASANRLVYNGGLKIYSCMNSSIQRKLAKQINKDSNYVDLQNIKYDKKKNILNQNGNVILRPYGTYLNKDGSFVLKKGEFTKDEEGNLIIKKGGRLALVEVSSDAGSSVDLQFRSMYTKKGNDLSMIESGSINIPYGYTSFNKQENCVVSAKLFEDYPDILVEDGDNYKVSSDYITLSQKVPQPQAAAVIIDNKNGEVKALSGGRDCTGRKLFNRAVNPRQPGSNIKPLAVYSTSLQESVELMKDGKSKNQNQGYGDAFGQYMTAGSVINDAPVERGGKVWPKNSSGGYMGPITMRNALRYSVNTCAVKLYENLPQDYIVNNLKNLGITTVVEDGEYNDLNPAALALGGMTKGISPLELAAAYATFPNEGVYREPLLYDKVLNSDGEVILESDQKETRVYDEGVAFIMTDMLKGVVRTGTGTAANIGTQPVAGKTGTTSDQYDIWFTGFTPQYTMSLWEGSDVNIQLTSMSSAAASFWSHIMKNVCEGLPTGSFPSAPSNITYLGGEFYVRGTIDPALFTTTTTEPVSEETAAPAQ